MSRMHNQYRELESSYNYIDKTECLEKEIERFPSVYRGCCRLRKDNDDADAS